MPGYHIHICTHVYIHILFLLRLIAHAWKVENASPGASFHGVEKPEGMKKEEGDENPNPRARPLLHYHMIYVRSSPSPECGLSEYGF